MNHSRTRSAAGSTARPLVETGGDTLRVAMVTNIPAPYRIPVYDLLAAMPGIDLKVFFCSPREPDRLWSLPELRSAHVVLRQRVLRWRGRYIHANPDVWAQLRAFRPQVVVTTGFNPTHLMAYLYARWHSARHIAMTDGTALSEARLTIIHRWLRRRVFRQSDAFVGASEGSLAMYRSYGAPGAALFKSALCADNAAFAAEPPVERDVDLIFSGRFVPGKLPLFAIAVAAETGRRLQRRVRMLILGAGALEPAMRHAADAAQEHVDAQFVGFAAQSGLPAFYARARVALFPTEFDPWGVVANEACAAGVPVLVSPQAGAANDLVVHGDNGQVLPLDTGLWAAAAVRLLVDAAQWRRMSARSIERVQGYTYANAAQGLAQAIAHATTPGSTSAPIRTDVRRRVAP